MDHIEEGDIESKRYMPRDRDEESDRDREIYRLDEEGAPPRRRRRGILGAGQRFMDLLVEHGVEERGIQPRPEDERDILKWSTYLLQFTFWAALNTNILTVGIEYGFDLFC